jgi:DNA ligase-1
MLYRVMAEVLQKLEQTPGYLEKNALIVELLKQTPVEEMERVVYLLLGRPWPAYVSKETGVGPQQLKKALSLASGHSLAEIERRMAKVGDLGEVAAELMRGRKQVTLFSQPLTVERVFEKIRSLPDLTGEGSMDRKIGVVAELLSDATPLEAKFVVRTVLGDLRVGIAEGRMRDAIAATFGLPPELVEHAYMLTTDYAVVARAAAQGEEALRRLGIEVGHPVNPMLAQRAESVEEILERMGGKAAFELKLDGIRIQAHRDGERITLFTRRMEDYTYMFPDLVDPLRKALRSDRMVVDGELVAIDPKSGKPMPFQEVLRRRRKYGIEEMAGQIPIQIHLFDVLVVDGKTVVERPYEERRRILERKVEPVPGKVMVVERRVTGKKEEVEEFLRYSLSLGHEGLVAKQLDSPYRAGRREFLWLKLKPEVDTVDLVVVGAHYGKGKRAGTFGSYVLAARDEKTGTYKTVTRCGSGYTDEDLEELTRMFEGLRVERPPQEVEIEIECDAYFRPEVVFEVAFEEIQLSPPEKHTGGVGLRFPRFIRVREDRRPEEATTLEEILQMYRAQQKRKGEKGSEKT